MPKKAKPKAARGRKKNTAKPKVRNKNRAVSVQNEAKWQRESDARMLQDAEKLKSDPKRMSAAKGELKRQATAASNALKNLNGTEGES